MNSNQNNNRGKGGGNKRNMTAIVSILLWALVLTLLVNLATSRLQQANSVEVSYGQFRQLIMQDAVESVVMSSGKYTFTLKEGYSLSVGEDGEVTVRTPEEGGQDSQAAQTPQESGTTGGVLDLPLLDGTAPQQQPVQSQNQAQSAGGRESLVYFCAPITQASIRDDDLVSLLEEHGVTNFGPEYVEPINPILSVLLSWVLPMVLIMVVFSLLMRGMAGKMGGGIGNLGKSNAKVYVERKTGVTFKDVAGQDEAKESLVEIIDFLHNPQKYTEIGAKLPKGALLVGPPGTGKTLLAKAVAGEANVPFFSISGSDFVEMFVGMGAARVRDLFKEANKMAPCIVFIDEIDTIGKSRDNRMGGNDEREQTLNQLLAEMDGFDPTKGVILLAATNRPEVLDQALLRPGRFDRRIIVDRPNLAGRLATLQVHTRNIRLAEDVNLRKIAIATAGTVGADLANLVNEAALRAVRLGRKAVNQEDLLAAFELVIAGAEKKGSVLSEFEKKLVEALEENNIFRGMATVIRTSSGTRKIPIAEDTGEASWIDEGEEIPESDTTFGQTMLSAYKLGTMIKISNELLNDSAFDLATYIARRFGVRMGNAEERAFITGDGVGKPLGLLAETGGAKVGVTAAQKDAVSFDEIFKLYYALKAPYRKKAQFLCNEALVLQLMTIKDNNGNYIWKPGLEIGKPDTLLNRPLKTSAFMPEIKGGSKVMAFGDYSYYWVADRQNRTFRRLNELYARTDQVGFLTTQRVDGKLILPEAVQLLQMAPQG